METIDRRSAMLLGAALLAPVVGSERTAHAAMYAKDAGKEIMPGVRQVDLGKWPVNLLENTLVPTIGTNRWP